MVNEKTKEFEGVKMTKTKKREYKTGNKKLKNVKMFEDFFEEDLEDDDIFEGKDPSEITSKDTMRVEDIMKKAGGTWNYKAEQLTRQMINSIKDGSKALRRGLAAQNKKYDKMAMLFFLKAGALGIETMDTSGI